MSGKYNEAEADGWRMQFEPKEEERQIMCNCTGNNWTSLLWKFNFVTHSIHPPTLSAVPSQNSSNFLSLTMLYCPFCSSLTGHGPFVTSYIEVLQISVTYFSGGRLTQGGTGKRERISIYSHFGLGVDWKQHFFLLLNFKFLPLPRDDSKPQIAITNSDHVGSRKPKNIDANVTR